MPDVAVPAEADTPTWFVVRGLRRSGPFNTRLEAIEERRANGGEIIREEEGS